jgi:uncharacterized protein involved in exopolysaccharide biosynthesis
MSNLEKEFTTRQESGGDEIYLFEYFKVIFKYWVMIFSICGIAIATTVVVIFLSADIFSATTTIVPPVDIIQNESDWAHGLGAGKRSVLANVMGVMNIAGIYIHILESRVVADAIIDRFDLLKVYDVKERFMAREILEGNTSFEATNEGILYITVKDKDPCMAAAMANAYVEELDRLNKRLSSGQATSKRQFIEKRLKEIDDQLSDIINIPKRKADALETLYGTLVVEYELARIEEAKSMPTIAVLDEANVPEVRMSRGAKRKVALAGFVSFIFVVFSAFVREHFAGMKAVISKRGQLLSVLEQSAKSRRISFGGLESRRRIVETRRKLTHGVRKDIHPDAKVIKEVNQSIG